MIRYWSATETLREYNLVQGIHNISHFGISLLPFNLFCILNTIYIYITKASEASWSYSCDSKVSFDPHLPSPHLPPSPPPCLPPIFPPSLLPLRKFDSVLSSLFGMRLALRILRPHSLTLTLTLSLSHCLSHLSHLSHLFLISLSSLSLSLSLSLSSLSLVFPSLFSLFSRRRVRAKSHI